MRLLLLINLISLTLSLVYDALENIHDQLVSKHVSLNHHRSDQLKLNAGSTKLLNLYQMLWTCSGEVSLYLSESTTQGEQSLICELDTPEPQSFTEVEVVSSSTIPPLPSVVVDPDVPYVVVT